MAQLRGYSIREVPITWYFKAGSKVHAFRDTLSMGRDLITSGAMRAPPPTRAASSPTPRSPKRPSQRSPSTQAPPAAPPALASSNAPHARPRSGHSLLEPCGSPLRRGSSRWPSSAPRTLCSTSVHDWKKSTKSATLAVMAIVAKTAPLMRAAADPKCLRGKESV